MNTKLKTCLLAILLFGATNAYGWGTLGHTIICHVAEQHLTPEAKQKCRHYLQRTLAYHASWMDHWRNIPPYSETSYWHCSNADENNKLIQDKGYCAALQADNCYKILKGYRKLNDSVIELNLKLLIHLVGDLHCPSHMGYTDMKGKAMYVGERRYGWHSLWDSSPLIVHPDMSAEDFYQKVDKATRKEIKKICKGTAQHWGVEQAHKIRKGYTLFERNAQYNDLPADEKQAITEFVDENLLKAAYRLAYMLNTIFAK